MFFAFAAGLFAGLPLAVLALAALLLSMGSCVFSELGLDSPPGSAAAPAEETPVLREIHSAGSRDGIKVARIPIKGEIDLSYGRDSLFGSDYGSCAFALDSIKAASADPAVKGIVLEIDSPGGSVTDSDVLYREICKFKESGEGRFVVAIAGDICASGGYYIAAASDYLMLHPTTVTGSIGVIMPMLNLKGLADRLGISEDPIASGKNKAMGGFTGDVTPEQRAILQGVVDSLYARFVDVVSKGRKMPKEDVAPLADGRIFGANDAVECGLADGTGYFDDALNRLSSLLGGGSLYVVRYCDDGILGGYLPLRDFFSSLLSKNLGRIRHGMSAPRFSL